MREGYSVTVSKHGEPILTIESAMLSGAELSAEDEQAIRDAGQHLLSFIGPELVECPRCGGSGFTGPETGYDGVCSECGGQRALRKE